MSALFRVEDCLVPTLHGFMFETFTETFPDAGVLQAKHGDSGALPECYGVSFRFPGLFNVKQQACNTRSNSPIHCLNTFSVCIILTMIVIQSCSC